MRTKFGPSILFAILLAIPVYCQTDLRIVTAYDGKPPYSKAQLIQILKLKALPESEIDTAVLNRGIDVRMTPEVTAQFEKAGAWPDLINELNISYRPNAASKIEGSDFDGYAPFCSDVPKISSQEIIDLYKGPVSRAVIVNMVRAFGIEPASGREGVSASGFVAGDPIMKENWNMTDEDAEALNAAAVYPHPASQGYSCSFVNMSNNQSRDITLETYKSVRLGMSIIEVRRIFSWPTSRQGLFRSNGYLFEGFSWYSTHLGGMVYALFRNEQLVNLFADNRIPSEVQPVPSRAPLYDAAKAAQASRPAVSAGATSPSADGASSSANKPSGGSQRAEASSTSAPSAGSSQVAANTTAPPAGSSQPARKPVESEAEKRAREAGVTPRPSSSPILGRWVADVVLQDPNGAGRSLRVHVQLDLSVVTEGSRQGQLGGQVTIDGTTHPLDTASFEWNTRLMTTSREDDKNVSIVAELIRSQLRGIIGVPVGQESWVGDFVAKKVQ